jgi:hypothetical protein
MARWPRATYQPVSTVGGSFRNPPLSVCLHHQVGMGNPASVYESRRVSAHFWIPKTGNPVQHCDTSVRAWHGGTDALNYNAIGVETEGCASPPHAEPLTENQLNLFAELMQWANTTHGIPLVLSESASAPGLNYHRCQGGFNTACPCDVRVNARPEILRRAGVITPGGPAAPSMKGREMIASTSSGQGYWTVTTDGAVYAFGDAQYHGGTNTGALPAGRKIVGIAGRSNDGYWLLSDGGDLYAYGSAPYRGKPDRV